MGTLNSSQFSNDFTMALSHFLIAFLALGLVAAEEMEFEKGLSADEILNTEFAVEYSDDDRTIDEIIAAAGTAAGAAQAAGENQEVNFDMNMNPAQLVQMAQSYHPLQNRPRILFQPAQYDLRWYANVDEKDLHQICASRQR